MSLSMKWGRTLVAITYKNMESGRSCRTLYMMGVNIVSDLYQVDEVVTVIKEWKKIFQLAISRALEKLIEITANFLLNVLETFILSQLYGSFLCSNS